MLFETALRQAEHRRRSRAVAVALKSNEALDASISRVGNAPCIFASRFAVALLITNTAGRVGPGQPFLQARTFREETQVRSHNGCICYRILARHDRGAVRVNARILE